MTNSFYTEQLHEDLLNADLCLIPKPGKPPDADSPCVKMRYLERSCSAWTSLTVSASVFLFGQINDFLSGNRIEGIRRPGSGLEQT